ncbi:hypothetical protein CFP65_3934 [Kitasatospora sp. MMS16-BH015]|uniref:SAM-dependent methyltransferase n=1 Tax=Kitasatospora sp. MMS16-BH015 TaxID=2018025 RepID=UPI000CA20B85|nr:SAM-dependent methyltransferase [Kitasatospora sp. MMS16-BH015]AUG78706.1 hypothetical protein CFP65_3934 [Kitasatospora sp. MMS16-BH015]
MTIEINAAQARVYDNFIGGDSGFETDRAAGFWIRLQAPDLIAAMQENRAFLSRAVRWLSARGIDRFIDIGSGFPLSPNTHETVLAAHPEGSVVYCDLDPTVGERTRALIAEEPRAAFVPADIREPEAILAQPAVRALIEAGRPVACILAAVLHFVPEEADPARITAVLRDALPAGSHLVISHVASDLPWRPENSPEVLARATEDMHLRSAAQIAGLFEGFELLDPGVVPAAEWHPDAGAVATDFVLPIHGAVGRKA